MKVEKRDGRWYVVSTGINAGRVMTASYIPRAGRESRDGAERDLENLNWELKAVQLGPGMDHRTGRLTRREYCDW